MRIFTVVDSPDYLIVLAHHQVSNLIKMQILLPIVQSINLHVTQFYSNFADIYVTMGD